MGRTGERRNLIKLISSSEDDTVRLGVELGGVLRGGEVLLLEGPLGSGKTTLVKGVAKGLGVVREVTSPSFVLEKVYKGIKTLRHIDLYRLEGEEAAGFWGFVDADPDDVLAVEWGERVARVVPGGIRIDMQYCDDNAEMRIITISWDRPETGDAVRNAVSRWRRRESK